MRILVAIDGSPCSEAAIAEVAARLWPEDCDIRVISVVAPAEAGLLRHTSASVLDDLIKQERADLESYLRLGTRRIAKAVRTARVTSALLEGWPKETIVDEAKRWQAELIVVGSHGYGPIRQFFLGSVSMYVAQYAPCSVQIVRQMKESLASVAE